MRTYVWLFSPPGSSVHGIFHARILEWVAISFSRGYSWSRNRTCVSCVSCIRGADSLPTEPFYMLCLFKNQEIEAERIVIKGILGLLLRLTHWDLPEGEREEINQLRGQNWKSSAKTMMNYELCGRADRHLGVGGCWGNRHPRTREKSVSGLMREPNTIFPSSDGKAWWELVLSEQFHRPWVKGVRGWVGAVTHSYYLKKSKVHESEKHIKKTGHQAEREGSWRAAQARWKRNMQIEWVKYSEANIRG